MPYITLRPICATCTVENCLPAIFSLYLRLLLYLVSVFSFQRSHTQLFRGKQEEEKEKEKMVVSSSSVSSPPFQSLSSLLSTKPFHFNNKSQPSICVSARFRASADVPDFLSADWYFFHLFFLNGGVPFFVGFLDSIVFFLSFFSRVCLKLIDVIGRNLGCFAFS